MKNFKKLRYGGVAIALTALIIAVIVLFNVVFTSLAMSNAWYIDMTPNSIYSLSDECLSVIKTGVAKYNEQRKAAGEDEVSINIYFCSDPDNLMANESMRYIYETARMLEEKCDFINIEHLNWRYNPSTVEKYKALGSTINAYSVIIDADEYHEEGNRWFAYSASRFFVANSSGSITGYGGEKLFATAILSVASSESPIAYVTQNHGETFIDTALLDTLTFAGYKVEPVDISKKDFEFSEHGKLLVVYNPTTDFLAGEDGAVNEIEKIDEFLNDQRSMMVFMNPDSPILPNFEEYLETWGVVFQRHADEEGNKYSYAIRDTQGNSYSSDGYSLRAEYAKNNPIASSIIKSVTANGEKPTPNVVFKNAMSIAYSTTFTEKRSENSDSSLDYTYAESNLDYVNKIVYDVFTAPQSAVAVAAGNEVDASLSINKTIKDIDGKTYGLDSEGLHIVDETGATLAFQNGEFITPSGTRLKITDVEVSGGKTAKSIQIVSTGESDAESSPYKLMTMSVRREEVVDPTTGNTSEPQNSYVLCCGSTDFATSKYLTNQVFGNSDVMLATSQITGREIVAVTGIPFKSFKNYQMSDITEAEANQYTVLLVVLPPVLVFAAGAVILIRRKYS